MNWLWQLWLDLTQRKEPDVLESLKALVADAVAAADRLIAKAEADASALEAKVAQLEADAVAEVKVLADKLIGAAPPADVPAEPPAQ